MKILVVDDSRTIQRAMELYLRGSGHEVVLANNGMQGILLAVEHMPDLMFIDDIMPHMNGREVLEKLREHESTRDILVVMLTGDLNLAKARPVGSDLTQQPDGWLTKPFSKEQLPPIIDRMRLLQVERERRLIEEASLDPEGNGCGVALRNSLRI